MNPQIIPVSVLLALFALLGLLAYIISHCYLGA